MGKYSKHLKSPLLARRCIQCNLFFHPTTAVHNLCSPACRKEYLDRPLSERKPNMPKEDDQKTRLAKLMKTSLPVSGVNSA